MAYKSFWKTCRIALGLLALFFVVTPARALQVYLQDTDGNPLPSDARWRVSGFEEGIWYESGAANTMENVYPTILYFYGKNVIWPDVLVTNINGPNVSTVTLQFPIYSNAISVIMNGPPTGSLVTWRFTAQPDALTNSTSYQTAYTNSFAVYDVATNILTAIPHGTYEISPGAVQGYATPAAVTMNIAGDPLTNEVSLTYVAYSNVITVTVYGFPTGNCEYTITGPNDFTNATGYKATYTNNVTIASVPTGSYVFNFPGVLGYSTPTNTLEITGDPLTNDVEATYVLAYPTNIPSGTGIQKFYQKSYFFTNVYLHDSGVPLHLRFLANITNTAWGEITGTLSDQTDLQAALDGKASTVSLATVSGMVVVANGNITTNAQNFAAHSNNTDNPHSITLAQIGAAATASNLTDLADTNAARSNISAVAQADFNSHIGNESADIQHLTASEKSTATNAVQSGDFAGHTNNESADIQHLTAAEKAIATNAVQSGDFAGHTNNESADIQHLTAAEKAIATNAGVDSINDATGNLRFQDGTNTSIRVDGTNIYVDATDTGATNIVAGASDSYTPATRTLTWNTNAAGSVVEYGTTDSTAYRGDWGAAVSNSCASNAITRWSGYPATQMIQRVVYIGSGTQTVYSDGQFAIWSDNTNVVYDQDSGLMWARDGYVLGDTNNWFTTTNLVDLLDYAGYTDWRLPSDEEVETILPIPSGHPFFDLEGRYWTSTEEGSLAGSYAYTDSIVHFYHNKEMHYFRAHPVRNAVPATNWFGMDKDGVFKSGSALFSSNLTSAALTLGGERRTNWPGIPDFGTGTMDVYRGDWGAVVSNRLDNSPLMTNALGVAIGKEATADEYWGTAVGRGAVANASGVAIGANANADTNGVAVGYLAHAEEYGVGVGYEAQGTNYGVGVGLRAKGNNGGVAIGCESYAYGGWNTYGTFIFDSVAIGSYVSNDVKNSTLVKGLLRTTNGLAVEGGTLNMSGNDITDAGTVTTTNLIIKGGSPDVGAMLLASSVAGGAVWGTNRSYVTSLYLQTTNTVLQTITCGFRPSTIIAFAGVVRRDTWSVGFYGRANNVAQCYSRYDGTSGMIDYPYPGLVFLHSGVSSWEIPAPTILTNGISFTPVKASSMMYTNNLNVIFLFLE